MKCSFFVFFIILGILSNAKSLASERPGITETSSKDYIYYKNTRHDLTDWQSINTDTWTSFETWKEERMLKDSIKDYERIRRDRRLSPISGRVVECIGHCRVYRGTAYAYVQYKSDIRDGDEFVTEKDSYAWVLLFDGTLVRISPESRISFLELNVGKEILSHARISKGEIFWLSYDSISLDKLTDLRETDTLFLPLSFFEANDEVFLDPKKKEILVGPLGLMDSKKQSERLKKLMEENEKKLGPKEVKSFIVMPNSSIYGKNLRTHFVVTERGDSYLRNLDSNHFGASSSNDDESILLYLRDLNTSQEYTLETGKLYNVDVQGTLFTILENEIDYNPFYVTEYLVSRIPSILIAREMMLSKYALSLFSPEETQQTLARKEGRKLWDDSLNKRFEFLKNYSQKLESISLSSHLEIKRSLEAQGKVFSNAAYDDRYFEFALYDYITKREREAFARDISFHKDDAYLHSVTRSFWHYINRNKGKGKDQNANVFSHLR